MTTSFAQLRYLAQTSRPVSRIWHWMEAGNWLTRDCQISMPVR